jgi:hypothetical protein
MHIHPEYTHHTISITTYTLIVEVTNAMFNMKNRLDLEERRHSSPFREFLPAVSAFKYGMIGDFKFSTLCYA